MAPRPRRMLSRLSETACCCTSATRTHPIVAAIGALGLDLVSRRRGDDDPFGAALARRFAVAYLHALPFVRCQLGGLDRFRSLPNRGAVLQHESLLAVGGFDDEGGGGIIDLVECPDHRSLGWWLRLRGLGSIYSDLGRSSGRTDHTRRHQYRGCDCQQEDRQPHTCSGVRSRHCSRQAMVAMLVRRSLVRETPANVAAGGVDRGVQPIAASRRAPILNTIPVPAARALDKMRQSLPLQ